MISRETLEETLSQATQWKGCDWVTEFGPRKLNLYGLRSRHALLASKATRGEEAVAWKEAARWLEGVERDAARASDIAHRALCAAKINRFAPAIEWLREAESLEQPHPLPQRYRLLRERLEQFANQQPVYAGFGERHAQATDSWYSKAKM